MSSETTTPTSYRWTAADYLRLEELCLPPTNDRVDHRALRPERPEYRDRTRPAPHTHWTRALRQLEDVVSHGNTSSLDDFIGQWDGVFDIKRIPMVLQSVAAILYEQEYESEQISAIKTTDYSGMVPFIIPPELTFVITPIFEHMLLVDYGCGVYPVFPTSWYPGWMRRWMPMRHLLPQAIDFSRQLVEFVHCCKSGQLPTKQDWNYLSRRLRLFRRYDMADLSLMLYYLHTHHQALDPTEYDRGMLGYTGVLQEIISEVPTKGVDRLVRKLSTDVNETIPKCVWDPDKRRILIAAAEHIAAAYGLTIYTTEDNCVHQVSSGAASRYEHHVQDNTQGWTRFLSFLSPLSPSNSNLVISKEKKDV